MHRTIPSIALVMDQMVYFEAFRQGMDTPSRVAEALGVELGTHNGVL